MPKLCISLLSPTKKWRCFQILDRLCLSPTNSLASIKIWLDKQQLPTSFWDHTFPKIFMSKHVNSSSKPISQLMFPTINTPDTSITLVESRPFNSNILNLKPDLFNLWEKDQKLELKLSEFKLWSFRLLLNFLWEKFQTDKSSVNLSFRSHFHHISKL